MRWAKAILVGFALFGNAAAWSEVGRIKSHVGQASVNRAGRDIPVRPGLSLEQGDTIVTGKTGRVAITLVDNTRLALGPNSRASLTEYIYDRVRQTGSFVTTVQRGSLGVVSGQIAKSKRDAMRVHTPTSILGVRGTRFVVQVP